jgi:single-stranded DNA-binding protein
MARFAKLTAVGYLVEDPRKFGGDNGSAVVARYKIIHNPAGKDRQGNERAGIPVSCVSFGKQAETILTNAKKGSQILISGDLTTNQVAMKDGQPVKYKTGDFVIEMEVNVNDFQFLDKKSDSEPTIPTASKQLNATSAGSSDPF